MAFTNLNSCVNHTCVVGTTDWRPLSSTECTEIQITSPTAFEVYDGNASFLVPAGASSGDVMTFRGLTRASDLSAKSTSGTITIYYRTQFYSGLMQVTG